MTDNWHRFKDVFQAALALPREERSLYLDQICTEPSMRAELDALLICYQDAPASMVHSVAGRRLGVSTQELQEQPTAIDGLADTHDPLLETFIDHYQIIGKIGVQESVHVYSAVRIDGAQLKPVILSLLAEDFGAASLPNSSKQRVILASLEHPNIVQFLDLGVNRRGHPYWVRDHAEGSAIDQYCDQRHLSTAARLKLFLDACLGVQYGHQHFVGHGAICAESIIVDKDGNARVIDLGISDLRIHWGAPRAGKTGHLSPEQPRGARLTAAHDVFSLGVLLYRLLTSRSPFRKGGNGKGDESLYEPVKPSQALKRVGTEDVTPRFISESRGEGISRIRRQLSGDLDRIVLNAIHKDASRRYSSIEQFCGDIRLYLASRPISCRRQTWPYRAGKLLQRHWISLSILSVFALALMVFAAAMAGWIHR